MVKECIVKLFNFSTAAVQSRGVDTVYMESKRPINGVIQQNSSIYIPPSNCHHHDDYDDDDDERRVNIRKEFHR